MECSVPLFAISTASEVFQYLREVFFFFEGGFVVLGPNYFAGLEVTVRPTTEVANEISMIGAYECFWA